MSDQTERARRAAENQALFRSVNDRVAELNKTFEDFTPYGSWTCECANVRCIERIDMTLAEYEALRSHPRRFAVATDDGHVVPEAERVVERTERYWVVEKVGVAGAVAADLEPDSG
jgi:hypothetical protein